MAAPTRPTGSDFDSRARTNDFAAVNAYYHNDRFFQLVASLGFPLATYFDGTAFPVRSTTAASAPRHQVATPSTRTASATVMACPIHACYALADLADLTNPIGFATDWRWVLHELGGHGILYDHVGSANFGFSHSAGDSFAMILNDYLSEWHNGAAINRFLDRALHARHRAAIGSHRRGGLGLGRSERRQRLFERADPVDHAVPRLPIDRRRFERCQPARVRRALHGLSDPSRSWDAHTHEQSRIRPRSS